MIFVAELGLQCNGELRKARETIDRLKPIDFNLIIKTQYYTQLDPRRTMETFTLAQLVWLQGYVGRNNFVVTPHDKDALIDIIAALDPPAIKLGHCTPIEVFDLALRMDRFIVASITGSGGYIPSRLNTRPNQGSVMFVHPMYPAAPRDMYEIQYLRDKHLNIGVGFSDHTSFPMWGVRPALEAKMYGADIIERHVSISNETGSTDDAVSITPEQFKEYRRQIEEFDWCA